MAILQNQFKEFHDTIKLGTYDENKDLRDKRDLLVDEVREAIKEEKVPNTDKALTFNKLDQGSYAMNTGIKPKDGDFDIDVGLIFDVSNDEYDSHQLKLLVHDILNRKSNRTVKFNRPCITVEYAAGYHVDLAIYAKNNDDLHIAWGKQHNKTNHVWYKADPKGLTKWVKEATDDVDSGRQLRRCIRALKKWKQHKFNGNGNGAPPSIGLTIQIRKAFTYQQDNDLLVLIEIARQIKQGFSNVWDQDAGEFFYVTEVNLPVEPCKNVYYKMSNRQLNSFYRNVCDLLEALDAAKDSDCEHEASKILRRVFGSDFPLVEDSKATSKAPYVTTGHSA